MVKKKITITLFLIILPIAFLSARTAIGGAFSFSMLDNPSGNAALSLHHDSIPGTMLNFSFSLANSQFNFGASDDWWLKIGRFNNFMGYYLGIGGYTRVGLGDSFSLDAGIRTPAGFRIWAGDSIELFAELAPNMGIGFNPVKFPNFGIQGAIGFRFWF